MRIRLDLPFYHKGLKRFTDCFSWKKEKKTKQREVEMTRRVSLFGVNSMSFFFFFLAQSKSEVKKESGESSPSEAACLCSPPADKNQCASCGMEIHDRYLLKVNVLYIHIYIHVFIHIYSLRSLIKSPSSSLFLFMMIPRK